MTQRGGFRRNVGDVLAYENAGLPASPDTMYRATLSRFMCESAAGIALATTGKLTLARITLQAGDRVTSLGFVSGTTAGVTMTAWWLALFTKAGALLAQTPDQTNGAIAASAIKSVALATPLDIKESDEYEIGLMIAATTLPTVLGAVCAPAVATGMISPGRETAATYTTTAPATLPALTARLGVPYLFAV